MSNLDREEPDDAAKIAYINKVMGTTFPVEFEKEYEMPDDLKQACVCVCF